jgi:hypothetical protein
MRDAEVLASSGWKTKRKRSPYRSGRSSDWLKMKNPDAPAVKREPRRIGVEGTNRPIHGPSPAHARGRTVSTETTRCLNPASLVGEANQPRKAAASPERSFLFFSPGCAG